MLQEFAHPPRAELRHTPVIGYAVHLADKGLYTVRGNQYRNHQCSRPNSYRCVWEVPFAITSNSSSMATKHMWESRICYHTLLRPNTMTWLVHAVFNILVALFRDSQSIDPCALPEASSVLSEQSATLLWCTCWIHL